MEQTGKWPDDVPEVVPFPPIVAHIYEYFKELNRTRQNYGWGPVRFTFTEIDAWQRLTGKRLDAWELSALLRIDDAFIDCAAASQPKGG